MRGLWIRLWLSQNEKSPCKPNQRTSYFVTFQYLKKYSSLGYSWSMVLQRRRCLKLRFGFSKKVKWNNLLCNRFSVRALFFHWDFNNTQKKAAKWSNVPEHPSLELLLLLYKSKNTPSFVNGYVNREKNCSLEKVSLLPLFSLSLCVFQIWQYSCWLARTLLHSGHHFEVLVIMLKSVDFYSFWFANLKNITFNFI